MKTLLWLVGLIALLNGCKRDDPQPGPTEINVLVVNEMKEPLDVIDVYILGSTGSYFGGTRKDSTFAKITSDKTGKAHYKANLDSKWRVYVRPFYFPDYADIRFDDGSDGIAEIGKLNTFTAILLKKCNCLGSPLEATAQDAG